ncbi:hypothetical protein KIN20_015715 [Parelaphostrongylus tenuis]|uniref:Uncharacterized protein n=1 Tax=Parelaphostrongylus tenuis TaxID=148309 RepID=A0AAD5N137_PARTN|nr:hypothetical protein KIN20_015715 [Parelaphostrongylus tenuis]
MNTSMNGAVRDAHLILSNRKPTRRPINTVIPLELDHTELGRRSTTKPDHGRTSNDGNNLTGPILRL